ncbi:MAG: hypothetical protein ABEJ81_06690 [Haloferacaceae archaeon]
MDKLPVLIAVGVVLATALVLYLFALPILCSSFFTTGPSVFC